MPEKYQVVIIGGGPGGYLAALRASSLNLKTALVEKDTLGGICLNHGCIPTKVLTHGAAMFRRLKTAGDFGFSIDGLKLNYSRLQDKKDEVVRELVGHIYSMFKSGNIDLYDGIGVAAGAGQVKVNLKDGSKINLATDNVILATGSDELIPGTPGIDLPGIMTSREALALRELPGTMAVIGGGVIALEMASIFQGLGVKVRIIHRSERLLRRMDLEMVRRLTTYLKKGGLEITMNAPVKNIETTEGGYRLTIDTRQGEEIVQADSVLLAIGRKPAFGDQDLNALGVEYHHNGIIVNNKMETSIPGIYAVGDVAYPNYYLAHTAYHQGIVAVENIAGIDAAFDGTAVPNCLFTDPELSSVGLTEEEVREKGLEEVKIGKFPFSASGKAATQGESEGTVKIIAAGNDEKVVGVHILGPHSSDLIQEGTMAVSGGLSAAEMAQLIHPHPTLSESVWEAAMAINKTSLHITRR
jgi:dihydrolipoamide dehydrogenase